MLFALPVFADPPILTLPLCAEVEGTVEKPACQPASEIVSYCHGGPFLIGPRKEYFCMTNDGYNGNFKIHVTREELATFNFKKDIVYIRYSYDKRAPANCLVPKSGSEVSGKMFISFCKG